MYGLTEVAKLAGIRPWQLNHMLTAGCIPEPIRVAGRRAWTAEEADAVRRYAVEHAFAARKPGRPAAGQAA